MGQGGAKDSDHSSYVQLYNDNKFMLSSANGRPHFVGVWGHIGTNWADATGTENFYFKSQETSCSTTIRDAFIHMYRSSVQGMANMLI